MKPYALGMCTIVILCGVVGLTHFAQAAEIDMSACYGNRLDVILENRSDPKSYVELSLPEPQRWHITGVVDGSIDDLPCLEEPIVVRHLVGNFGLISKDSDAYLEHLTRVIIQGTRATSRLKSVNENLADFVKKEGIDLPAGFRRRTSIRAPDHSPSSNLGIFEFPEQHRSPVNHRVYWVCGSWTGKVTHGFESKVFASFEIQNEVEFDQNWVARDQALQDFFHSWIK